MKFKPYGMVFYGSWTSDFLLYDWQLIRYIVGKLYHDLNMKDKHILQIHVEF
jgi:hypothetical protein